MKDLKDDEYWFDPFFFSFVSHLNRKHAGQGALLPLLLLFNTNIIFRLIAIEQEA